MDFFERYEPQISKSSLLNEVQSNYNVASNYYLQRQKLFEKVLQKQAHTTLKSFKEEINKKLENVWKKNIYNILEDIYFDKNKSIEQKITKIKTTFATSSFLNEYIEAIKKPNYNLFKGRMGILFEQFINNEIFNPYLKDTTNFINGHLQSIVSGGLTSFSSVTKGQKNIRSDLLISVSGVELSKDNGVLKGGKGSKRLPLELQRELKINWDNAFPSFDNEMMKTSDDGIILNRFLENGDFFGFSAKVYSANEDNKHFSQSSVVQKALNEVFWYPYRSNRGSVKRHSWEIDYAEIYVIWNLSKILRTLVSPTTIAMIYGDQLMWLSSFFQSKVFYMNISYQTQIKERYAGDGRIFPTINSPGIYTKNYNISKGLNALKTTIVDKKNYYNNKSYKGINIILS